MGEGTSRLRDRMVRDAIVEILSGLPGLEDAGRVPDVRVEGDWVRLELRLPGGWPSAAPTVGEVERRLRSLPEVARSQVVVVIEQGVSTQNSEGGTMSRRLVATTLVVGWLGTAVGVAPPARAAETECTGTAQMTVSPGVSQQPTSGTHAARNGTERCTGPLNGADPTGDPTVDWDGRYGTANPDTCAGGGEGWGVADHTVPTKNGPKVVRNVFTISFGGLENGLMSGTFRGDYFSGSFTFRPLEGDCVTAPVTRVEVRFRGTWHDYRAN